MKVLSFLNKLRSKNNKNLESLANDYPDIFIGPVSGLRDFNKHKEEGGFLGVDYDVGIGTNIVSAADGPILLVQERNRGGLSVLQEHGDGYVSFYAHLSEALVNLGQQMKRGQYIGKSGDTGKTDFPILHYGIGRLKKEGFGHTEWFDPHILGEGEGIPKYFEEKIIIDNINSANRIYYKNIVNDIKRNVIEEYEEEFNLNGIPLPDIFRNVIIYNEDKFIEGTLNQYDTAINTLLNPKTAIPVILTSPVEKPNP